MTPETAEPMTREQKNRLDAANVDAGAGAGQAEQTETDTGKPTDTIAAGDTTTGQATAASSTVDSTSDARVVNNVMRHAYRVLSDEEKAAMQKVKDMGLEFHTFVGSLSATGSRELSVAKTKIEEAVMWAVKHITA